MSDHLMEILIAKKEVYRGRMIHLRVDTVRLPNGKETTREVVEHPGAVAVVAVTKNDGVLLVRQYRHAVGELSVEIPAGKLEADEPTDDAAKRELLEETGYQAQTIQRIRSFYSTPGFSDEIMHLYVASGLQFRSMNLDEDEFLDCDEYSRAQVAELIHTGKITDAKTLVGLYWWLYEGSDH